MKKTVSQTSGREGIEEFLVVSFYSTAKRLKTNSDIIGTDLAQWQQTFVPAPSGVHRFSPYPPKSQA
jgi:hypothetical protein